ncbi:hypothetical protein [Glutamicibacter endophyticus]
MAQEPEKKNPGTEESPVEEEQTVREWEKESFPASDPPANY